jgi:hypothetical protein
MEGSSLEPVSEAIAFGGHLTEEVETDCRSLYAEINLLAWLRFSLVIAVLLFLALSHVRPVALSERLICASLAALTLAVLWCPRTLCCQMWWSRLRRDFGNGFSGVASERWVRWVEDGGVFAWFAWSDFVAVKRNRRAMLLYVSQVDPLPLHRSMFASDADWQQVCDWVKDARVPIHRFGKRVRP